MAGEGTPIRGKTFRVPDPTDAIPLSPDGYTTVENLPGGTPIVTVIANDTDITVAPFNGTTIVLYTSITVPRILTLPPAAGPAQIIIVKDVHGDLSSEVSVVLTPSDGDSIFNGPTADFSLPFDLDFDPGGGPHNLTIGIANDRVSNWVSTNDSTEVVLETSIALAALQAQLGGTDGDGNVYSIQYDPDDAGLEIRCVKPDTTILRVGVFDGVAGVRVDGPAGQTYLTIVNGNVSFQLTDADSNQLTFSADPNPATGAQIIVQNADASITGTMVVNQNQISLSGLGVPLKLFGVPEGDPHQADEVFTLGYVEGVSAGSLMISAG